MNRMLVEIWMVKAIPMKSWTETRNVLPNNREKKAECYKVAKKLD